MSDEVPEARYPFTLEAGQAVRITVEAISGDLDPIIGIEDAQGETVALNDDGDIGDLNSDLAYISPATATYTLVVGNISPTSGEYRVTMSAIDPAEAATVGRVSLSGPALANDTTHFRIHYTIEGEDATTLEFAAAGRHDDGGGAPDRDRRPRVAVAAAGRDDGWRCQVRRLSRRRDHRRRRPPNSGTPSRSYRRVTTRTPRPSRRPRRATSSLTTTSVRARSTPATTGSP